MASWASRSAVMRRRIELFAHDTGDGAHAGADGHAQQKAGKPLQRKKDDPRRNQKTGSSRLAVII